MTPSGRFPRLDVCLLTLGSLVAAVAFAPAAVAAPGAPLGPGGRPPNILFIYADDQSYRTMSANEGAYPWVRTPNMDALARRGVRFQSAYMPSWCMPSRAMLLTGKLPYAVESMRMEGKYPGSAYDPRKAPFWPKVFRQQGYVTAQIGKWHTGTDTGFGRDWDYQAVWNRPRHVENAGSYYGDQLIEVNGGKAELIKGYPTDNYTKWATDFINGAHRDPKKPWYLWLCYGAAHGPYTPAERHRGAYKQAAVMPPKDILPPRLGKPEYVQKNAVWERGPDGKPRLHGGGQGYAEAIRQYNETVMALDEGIGRVLAALERSGQLKNTLVVFTADQGFAYGEHGFRHKLGPYDANNRPPFVVSMPGTLPEGAVTSAPVSGADLVPTFFRFAGLVPPWKMHGRDLTPLLLDPKRPWHPVLMVHTGKKYGSDTARIPPAPAIYDEGVPWWALLREGRWKYIRTLVEGETEELYDLQADPEELVNLAGDPGHAATVKKLRASAVAELRRLDAPFVDRLPAVRPLPLALR